MPLLKPLIDKARRHFRIIEDCQPAFIILLIGRIQQQHMVHLTVRKEFGKTRIQIALVGFHIGIKPVFMFPTDIRRVCKQVKCQWIAVPIPAHADIAPKHTTLASDHPA